MNRGQRMNRKSRQGCGPFFAKVSDFLLVLILGTLLFCPQARAVGEQQLTLEEQRVVYKAQQAIKAKKYTAAQKTLLAFMSRKGEQVHYLVPFTLGDAFALNGRNKEALTYYQLAARQCPENAGLRLNMAKVCYDLKKYNEAGRKTLEAYELQEKKEPDLLYQAAICFLKGGQPQEAKECLEPICAAGKREAKSEWLEAMIEVDLQLGRRQEAAVTLRRLLEVKGDDPRLWKLMVHLYAEAKDYGAAAAAQKVYLDLVEADQEDVVRMGDLYRLVGAPLQAAREYERALRWTADEGAYKKIASAYLAAHRPDEAAHALRQGIADKPSTELWRMLGSVKYNEGKYQEAYDAFRQSLSIDAGDGGAALLMGYCALQLDKPHEAAKAFQSAARFSQQRAAAQKALAQIERLAQWEAGNDAIR